MKTRTTFPDFDKSTIALEVAAAFPQSIRGRTVLITGVNRAGLGYATAEAFASQSPKSLILAGRSRSKLDECVDALRTQYSSSFDIDIRVLVVDLSSQKSIRSASKIVLHDWTDIPGIDLVINNAGIMRHGERFDGPMPKTEGGIEEMFAVNHLGHFLLTNLIMPKIIAASTLSSAGCKPRIVNLPANERPNLAAMKQAGMQIDDSVAYIPTAAYGHSKACNVLFSVGLNKRLFDKYSILSLALNPGEVSTELARHTDPGWLARAIKKREDMGLLFRKTTGQGASTTLVAACDPLLTLPDSDGTRGYFLSDCQIDSRVPPHVADRMAAEKLWRISEELTGQMSEF